jgi:diadenosine tetraphosphatase ApaH/serine/threonine PP2A family protein phosphatase
MRYAVLSDIHANAEAFSAVMDDIKKRRIDKTVCLGDLVGYCASPKTCLKMAKKLNVILMGNHDYAIVNSDLAEKFTFHARIAVEWTRERLTAAETGMISDLPFIYREQDATFVHATPMDPRSWVYIIYLDDAMDAFGFFNTPLCFIGHSHYPIVFSDQGTIIKDARIVFEKGVRYLVNVGSVGQPRDADPRACYVIYDQGARTVEYVRLAYDVRAAQRRMEKAGLPSFLIKRLNEGR